jgi:transposase
MMSGGGGDRRRRYWTLEEKRRIVEESQKEDASIADVARRHDVNANLVFTWRRKMGVDPVEQKSSISILPVTITSDSVAETDCPNATGQMEIVLAEGDRILVWPDVETAALTRVLKALSRR